MKAVIAAGLCLTILAGCVPYPERLARVCTSMGFGPPGSDRFQDCIIRQDAIAAQERAMWTGVMVTGVDMMARPAPQPWAASCTSFGNTMACSGN